MQYRIWIPFFRYEAYCSNVMCEPKSLQIGVTILRKCLFCLIVSKKKMNQVLKTLK